MSLTEEQLTQVKATIGEHLAELNDGTDNGNMSGSDLAVLSHKVDSLVTSVSKIDQALTGLTTNVAVLGNKVESVQEDMRQLDTKFNDLDTKIDEKFNILDTKIDTKFNVILIVGFVLTVTAFLLNNFL